MLIMVARCRNPDYWEDPDAFRPERFPLDAPMPNEITHDFKYLPFGGGKRKCIGEGEWWGRGGGRGQGKRRGARALPLCLPRQALGGACEAQAMPACPPPHPSTICPAGTWTRPVHSPISPWQASLHKVKICLARGHCVPSPPPPPALQATSLRCWRP